MSYAQFGTDLAIRDSFPTGFVGTYLDIGAHHPVVGSNTYLLYLSGWRGVCVDAATGLKSLHRTYRPEDDFLDTAVSSFDGETVFFECDETSVSTVLPAEAGRRRESGQGVRARTVQALTVRSLVEMIPTFQDQREQLRRPEGPSPTVGGVFRGDAPDVLSIDVEGHERDVLLGCPFDAGWRPALIVLEACRPCTDIPCHEDWEDLLLVQGYRHTRTCGINRLYTAYALT